MLEINLIVSYRATISLITHQGKLLEELALVCACQPLLPGDIIGFFVVPHKPSRSASHWLEDVMHLPMMLLQNVPFSALAHRPDTAQNDAEERKWVEMDEDYEALLWVIVGGPPLWL